MYKEKKFRIRDIEEIRNDLNECRKKYTSVGRIFLADGNGLSVSNADLELILKEINDIFPECKRVGIYGAPKDILRKTDKEISKLKELGLGIIYLGIESGSDKVLSQVKKGVTAKEMIEAGKKVVKSGIILSTMIISGLGGKALFKEHAIESAKVISAINPNFVALLTLLVEPNTEIYDDINSGKIKLLTSKEVLDETEIFIKNIDVDKCVFRSNHASNYISLAGKLPEDKELLLDLIKEAKNEEYDLKEEFFRRL
jgi:radical SAM superfamily enzyme YgiQ (UPF0313 family)